MSRRSTRHQRQAKLLSSDGWNFGEFDMPQVGTRRQLEKQQQPRQLRPRPCKTPTVTKKKRGEAAGKRGGKSQKHPDKRSAASNARTTARARRSTRVAPTTARTTRASARRAQIAGAPVRSAGDNGGNVHLSKADTVPSACSNHPPVQGASNNRAAAAGKRTPAAPRRRNPFAAAMKPAPSTSRISSPRQPASALQRLRRAVPFARRTTPPVNSKVSEPSALNTEEGTLFSPVSLVTTPARFIRGVVGSSVQSLRTALFGGEKAEEVGGGNSRQGTISDDAGLSGDGEEAGGGSVAGRGARSFEAERRGKPGAAMVRRPRRRPD